MENSLSLKVGFSGRTPTDWHLSFSIDTLNPL